MNPNLEPKTIFHHAPKPLGVVTIGEDMCHHFLSLFAKRAKVTICLSSPLKTVRYTNYILEWLAKIVKHELHQQIKLASSHPKIGHLCPRDGMDYGE
jgi:hypothetical protein